MISGAQEMTAQASVPWKNLKLDLGLLTLAILIVVVSLIYDLSHGKQDLFQRSGAAMVVIAGYLAYRGLGKYWVKAENSLNRGYWLRTSPNQRIIDFVTLALLIIGTLIAGYGDKIFRLIT